MDFFPLAPSFLQRCLLVDRRGKRGKLLNRRSSFAKTMDSFMSERNIIHFIEKTTKGLTLLMIAARDENLESCLALLKSGESAEVRTNFGVTPLHFAALNKKNGIEIVWHLTTQEKQDVKQKDVDGEEAIFYAVRVGNFRVAQILLELREKTNNNLLHFCITQNRSDDVAQIIHAWNPSLIKEVDSNRRNALHLAAQFADLRVCKWLIAAGIDVSSNSFLGTALHRAPLNKNHGLELVRFFVSKKLDLNKKSESGFVPLDAALAEENIDIASELLRLGATLHIKDHNFLLHCVLVNKLNCVKFIHGFDKSLIRGEAALHIAAEFADLEMCRWLVENGVRTDSLNGKWQTSILHHVGYNKRHGTQLVRYFFHLGLDMNKQDFYDFTPLSYALGDKNFDVAEEMLIYGADFYAINDGMNIFHVCIMENNLEGVQFVLSKEPKIMNSLGKDGTNALHIAAAFADLKMCQWLSCGEKFDVLSLSKEMRNTVLHYVAMNKKFGKSLVPFFVSKVVNVNEKNIFSLSAFYVALYMENIAVAEELLKAGADMNLKSKRNNNVLQFCARNNKIVSAKFVIGLNEGLVREPTLGGVTALHLATKTVDLEFCKFLVEKGAEIYAKDFLERSVLVYVPRKNKEKRNFLSLGVGN